ncbi:MAG: AsmA family protein [Pseudomonadota bacterium]
MRTLLKLFAWIVGGVLALVLVAGLAFYLFFDPNDFKSDIETAVRDATGREFAIEGDISASLFPWLAVELGRTTLGNAEGFGDEPFVRFDSARLSIKLLPMIFRQEIAVGTASLESLRVNLAVDASGRSNWDDLLERQQLADEAAAADPEAGAAVEATFGVDVANIAISDAAFVYADGQAGSEYRLKDVNLETGRIVSGQPIPVDGGFAFELLPDGISGQVDLDVVASFDAEAGDVGLGDLELTARIVGATEAPAEIRLTAPGIGLNTKAQTAAPGALELSVFDLDMRADVEPFSYAGSVEPQATLSIARFSPKSLLTALGAELPETADPAALDLLSLDAKAAVSEQAIALSDIVLVVDDTSFRGRLSVPRGEGGAYELDLAGDSIDLNRYMAPADAEAQTEAAGEEPPVEIPSELLRGMNARGSVTLDDALMGAILFEDIELVLNLADGRLRLHPIASRLFEGEYQGDVRLDVSGSTPVLSVNEKIQNVSLAPLGKAMFERENLSGLINGEFVLTGRGQDMSEIQQTLNGNLSFELRDGAVEGTDVWNKLRRARAVLRQETPPEPEQPERTRFSEVSATGTVVDGVLNNDDFRAELPFMQLTGQGSVDLVAATLDYSLRGRVLDKPELMGDVTAEELDDFTRATVPVKISGSLNDPQFSLDFAEAAKERAKEEVRDRLLDLIGGGEEDPEAPPAEEGEPEEQEPEDVLKDRLRDLIKRD